MKVKFFAYIREFTGCNETDWKACRNVRELVLQLSNQYGRRFQQAVLKGDELNSLIIILVNGRHVSHLSGLETTLKEDDEICFFPVIAGG